MFSFEAKQTLVNCMLRKKKVVKLVVTGMAEITDLLEKSMLEEGLSPKGDSGKGPEIKELKTLKKKEVERLQLKKVERLQVKEEVSWTLKSAKVEVRLEEVVEWLVADPQVLKHCNALFLSSSVTEKLAK